MTRLLFCLAVALLTGHFTNGQVAESVYNYDETKVGTYKLPNPLINASGKAIKTRAEWATRRIELLQLFAENVYGKTPKQTVRLRFQTTSVDSSALNGLAIRKLISIKFVDYPKLPSIDVLLYVPKGRKAAPVFLGLNFCGNHCVTTEADLPLSTRWMMSGTGDVSVNNKATEKARGMQERRWPISMILKRGYAVATAYYGDLEPDYPEGWHAGIRSVLGDTTRADNWGAIGAWAWGMSRILDYLQTDPAIDAKRVISIGHSRIGKAALWAGAQDDRFAAVIANESGEGGAALSRRWYGETVERLNISFPHWFCERYKTYNKRVDDLPVDQHELLALVAPRPLYVASADGDQWSDPKGEFLGAAYTTPVYALYGKVGLGTTTFPAVNQPIGQTVRYHDRTGKHDVMNYDWEQYLRFADELVR
ncbi:glucuronyl esterase domain-containing protein [Spirosoma radiotolerans]|uniref:Acetyl xylan esterase n=1 Tax=Spirosoma radiotolerans TaxID=1379870 RepID=A0A0E4A1A5_9BACT|nr:alpha/beta hydrolase [Spirosoma radiotolerans]AKD58308.1 acetyl xylan esterase [Spirosoma radiotolerans]